MTTPNQAPDAPLAAATVGLSPLPDDAPSATADREPRGFAPRYFLASIGIYLAVFAPVVGGLSVKVQSLVPLSQAATQLGLVTGVGAFFALVSQPIVGRLSDRTMRRSGMRKPWIIMGAIGTFFALLGVGLAPNIPVLIVAWAGAQFFSNSAQAGLTATVADQVPEHRRGRISGLLGSSSSIAILIAAVGLSYLPSNLLRMAFPAVVGLVLALLFALTLKDRVLRASPGPFDIKGFLASFVFNPAKYSNLGWAWLTKALIMFGYGALTTYLTLYVAVDFGMTNPVDQLRYNLWATVISVVFTVATSIIGGLWSDRVRRRRIFVTTGGLLIGVGILLAGAAPLFGQSAGLAAILCAEAIVGMGAGLFLSVDTALVIAILPDKENTAKDLGVMNIANTLPQTIAPFVAGLAVIPLGNALFGAGYSVWFIVSAAVAIAGALLVYKVKGIR
ncbi:MFS transporter [Gryllotalpicola reticulitermitis]|uniref:MFS transporter n=1 Tax=Gryllotalpicola reticulitermitis TaxID=1184153 RepID=A0ABV8Q4R0_9MICO